MGDYEANPTNYVSRYGANYFHEDIADTFAVFVLGEEPQGDTVAEEKLRFFWADPDMVALRSAIRQDLGLDWPEEDSGSGTAPEQPEQIAVSSLEEVKAELTRAIAAAEQPSALDVSALEGQEELPLTVKNLYYGILSDDRTYSYAYDLTAEVGADGLLRCTISYMPYRTGAYPDGFQGTEVDGLDSLAQCARQGLAQERIPIRITDPTPVVDDMNRALQQVGGGLAALPAQPGWDRHHRHPSERPDPPAGSGAAGGDAGAGGADLRGDRHGGYDPGPAGGGPVRLSDRSRCAMTSAITARPVKCPMSPPPPTAPSTTIWPSAAGTPKPSSSCWSRPASPALR